MKKIVSILVLICISNWCKSQNLYPIKEQYEFIHDKVEIFHSGTSTTHNGILNYISVGYPFTGYSYGEALGPILESYIQMYKTTGDKAYLIKFINEALLIMSWRNTNYLFTNNTDNIYMDGLLLWPMAHFSNLVLYQDADLQYLEIPNDVLTIPTSTFSPNILPYQPNYTYGFIADWLVQKQVESLDAVLDNYWGGDDFGIGKDSYPLEINMQAGFGGALLYLGQLSSNVSTYSGLASYLDKGAAIARLYKGDISIDDKCSCGIYEEPVLRTNSENGYFWYHRGWRVTYQSCGFNSCPPFIHTEQQPDLIEYLEYIEDMSHAVSTMILPHVSNEINLYTYGEYPFSSNEMIRFKNTFTKNIFDGNFINPGFYNGVNGSNYPIYSNDGCAPSSCPTNTFKYSSMAYMPLFKYDDGDGSSVYDIVMRFYELEPYISPGNVSSGFTYFGLSHIVNAQWEKECVNLTMYNRKMIYDQDFEVKNILTIDPTLTDAYHDLNDNSFAEPIINSNEFTVEPFITVNMKAGESIVLKPGFTAKAGCNFTASIDPNICTDGKNMITQNESKRTESDPNKTYEYKYKRDSNTYSAYLQRHHKDSVSLNVNSTITENMLTIFPNPFNGTADIVVSLNQPSELSLKLINQIGNELVVFAKNETRNGGIHKFKITDLNLPEGVYFCIMEIDGLHVESRKLMRVR